MPTGGSHQQWARPQYQPSLSEQENQIPGYSSSLAIPGTHMPQAPTCTAPAPLLQRQFVSKACLLIGIGLDAAGPRREKCHGLAALNLPF
jgi:hypothetical protein